MPISPPSEQNAVAIACSVLGWPDATARRFTTGMAFFVYEVAHGDDLYGGAVARARGDA